jgi:hypothetical protein
MRKFQIEYDYFVPIIGHKMGTNKAVYDDKKKELVHDPFFRYQLKHISGCVTINKKDKCIEVRTEGIRTTTIEDINFPENNISTRELVFSTVQIVFQDTRHPFFAYKYEKDIKYLLHPDGTIVIIGHKDKFYETLH